MELLILSKMGTKEALARENLFKQVQTSFTKYSNRVLVEACTGAGKCKIALDLLKSDLEAGKPLDIVVPQDLNIETWEKELITWGYQKYVVKGLVRIFCYASLHKYMSQRNTIVDEAHTITPKRLDFLKAKTYLSKLICLGATIDDGKRKLLESLGITPNNTVVYTLDQGVEDTVVVPYSISVVKVPVDNVNKKVEVSMKSGKSFYTTEQANYDYLTGVLEDQEEEEVDLTSKLELAKLLQNKLKIQDYNAQLTGLEISLKSARLKRMRAVYDFPSKQLAAQYLLGALAPKMLKTIGFCGGIKQCEALFIHTYHSKTNKTDYDNFVANQIIRLGTVAAANMGINISDMDLAFIVQIQSKDIHLVQRIGRLLRKSADPNKIGRIIILVSEGTVDETNWCKKALSKLDQSRISYFTLQEVLDQGISILL